MKSLTLAMTVALALGMAAIAAEPAKKPAGDAPLPKGYTREVRYTTAPIAGKTTVVTKLIITRDPSGRIVSVNRG